MLFGDGLSVPATVAAARWIEDACRGAWGTVGALVPNRYPTYLRVRAPDPVPGDWWSAYRDLFAAVASIGAQHTSTPDRAWFAVWEGHGFDTSTTVIAWRDPPPDDDTRRRREAERSRRRDEERRRNAAIRAELERVPQFNLPHRTHYLLRGSVADVTRLRSPDEAERQKHQPHNGIQDERQERQGPADYQQNQPEQELHHTVQYAFFARALQLVRNGLQPLPPGARIVAPASCLVERHQPLHGGPQLC